jgi:hypothetical protein
VTLPHATFASAGHNARVDGCYARCDCGWLASRATHRRAHAAVRAHVHDAPEPDPRACRRCGEPLPLEAHDYDLCTPCIFTMLAS